MVVTASRLTVQPVIKFLRLAQGSPCCGPNWWKPKPSSVLRSGDRGPNCPGRPYNGDYNQDYEYIEEKAIWIYVPAILHKHRNILMGFHYHVKVGSPPSIQGVLGLKK